jgi:hypothetical protein
VNSSSVVIYQAFLGEAQRQHLDPSSLPLDIGARTANHQREYELFKLLMRHRKAEPQPWGMLSWKFQHKAQISVSQFRAFAEEKFKAGYDCVLVNPMIGQEAIFMNVWEQGQAAHQGMQSIVNFLESRQCIQSKAVMFAESFAFCNYFLATPRFWSRYFEFADHIAQLLEAESESGSEVGKIYSGSASYVKDPLLTMRPFVLERALSSFLIQQKDLKFSAYPWTALDFQKRFGVLLGDTLWKLSSLKRKAFELDSLELKERWGKTRRALFVDNMVRNLVAGHEDMPSVMFSPEVQSLMEDGS